MIDTQIGYEVLPDTPAPATPTHHDLQNKREREERLSMPTREKKKEGQEVRRGWKSVERIG